MFLKYSKLEKVKQQHLVLLIIGVSSQFWHAVQIAFKGLKLKQLTLLGAWCICLHDITIGYKKQLAA